VHQVHRGRVTGLVKVPAPDPDEHLVDEDHPGRRHQLRQARHRGRHLGPALGNLDRLDIEPGLQLHDGAGVGGQGRDGMVGA